MIRLIGKIRFVTHSPAVPLAALMASVRTLAPRLSTVDSGDTTRKLRRARLREEGFTHSVKSEVTHETGVERRQETGG